MNPTTKRLLAKDRLSGKDIGRLLVANLIDIYNDKGLPSDKIWELMQSLRSEKDKIDYGLYRSVFFALGEARDICAEKMNQARVACAGLQLFNEAVFFANITYPDCRWDKYCLGKMARKTRDTGIDLWLRLRNSVQASLATRGAFKAAGAWLKIPRLETILPSDKKLRLQVNAMDKFANQARDELDKIGLPKNLIAEAHEIFAPINFDLGQPSKDNVLDLQKTFKLETFGDDIEGAIAALNPYYEVDE